MNTLTETGNVKWFNEAKGYGFITPEDGGGDLFFHHSQLTDKSIKSLSDGQGVTYVIGESPKGPVAQDVVVDQHYTNGNV